MNFIRKHASRWDRHSVPGPHSSNAPTTANPASAQASTATARDLVVAATTAVFILKDATAVDRYFSSDYKQHSQLVGDGIENFRALASNLPSDFEYEPVRVLAEGNLVLAHGIYHGFGPASLVAFDVFRVEDDKIVEHWDALTPVVEHTASGRSQTDGAHEVLLHDTTASSRELVVEFAEKVLVGADY